MYVDFELAQQTAASIKGIRQVGCLRYGTPGKEGALLLCRSATRAAVRAQLAGGVALLPLCPLRPP